jgi:hypothetical protein
MTPEAASALACIADFLFFSWLMMLVRRRHNHRGLRYGSIGLFDTHTNYAQVLGKRPGVPITGSPAWLAALKHDPSSK